MYSTCIWIMSSQASLIEISAENPLPATLPSLQKWMYIRFPDEVVENGAEPLKSLQYLSSKAEVLPFPS